jgi:cell division protein FtsB
MNVWPTIYRSTWVILILLVIAGLVAIFVPKCRNLRQMQQRKAALQQENAEVEARTLALRQKQERFNTDPAYVERVAREIGMVRPDETVFHFTNTAVEEAGESLP